MAHTSTLEDNDVSVTPQASEDLSHVFYFQQLASLQIKTKCLMTLIQ